MKKIGKYLFALVSIVSLASCGELKGNGEKTMGYEQLKKITSGYVSRDYKVSIESVPREYLSMTRDSGFLYGKMIDGDKITLIDLTTFKPILSNMDYSVSVGTSMKCFSTDREAYLVNIYGEQIVKLDSFATRGTSLSIEFGTGFHDDKSSVFYKATISNYSKSQTVYLKYSICQSGALYQASNEEEFEKWQNYTPSLMRSLSDEGFDTKNLYSGSFSDTINIYNPKGGYLGSIPFGSFPTGSIRVRGSDGTYFIIGKKNEEKVVGSVLLDTINTYCFFVDLQNASWEYIDNLPWDIYSSIGYDGGAYLTAQPLNENRTSTLPYYQILDVTNSIVRPDVYDYDFAVSSKLVKAGKDALISFSGSLVYSISKKGRYPIEGVKSIATNNYNEDEIIYRNAENKMVLAKTAELAKNRKADSSAKGYDYITWDKYNGVHISSNSTSDGLLVNDTYKINPAGIEFYDSGIIVSEKSIAPIGSEGKTFQSKIDDVRDDFPTKDGSIFTIILESGAVEMVKIKRELIQ